MRLVAISDTHLQHRKLDLPEAEILVHAGDFSNRGSVPEAREFLTWFKSLDYEYKILVPGNHDISCEYSENELRTELIKEGIYFESNGVVFIEDLVIFCYSWTPEIYPGSPWGYTISRESESFERLWNLAPKCDLLITHGPPKGILDRTEDDLLVGEDYMHSYVMRETPRVHIFGHVHESYGSLYKLGTNFYNVSICNLKYEPVNKPTVIDL